MKLPKAKKWQKNNGGNKNNNQKGENGPTVMAHIHQEDDKELE